MTTPKTGEKAGPVAVTTGQRTTEPEIDNDLIDEAVLALLFLTAHQDRPNELHRAWKSFDWEAMNRLFEKQLIFDPVGKAKSVALTEDGLRRSEEAFYRLFAKRP